MSGYIDDKIFNVNKKIKKVKKNKNPVYFLRNMCYCHNKIKWIKLIYEVNNG